MKNRKPYSLMLQTIAAILFSLQAYAQNFQQHTTVVPSAPILISPSNDTTNQLSSLLLVWHQVASITSYHVQVARDSNFAGRLFFDDTTGTGADTVMNLNGLLYGKTYYWRVDARDSLGTSPWSTVWNFSTQEPLPNSWQQTSLDTGNVYALTLNASGTIFAGTYGEGVFRSTDDGASWTEVNLGLTDLRIQSLAVSGVNLLTGTAGGGLFLSTNDGATWTWEENYNVLSFATSGANVFAGTSYGVFHSTDNGGSWAPAGLTDSSVLSLAISGTNLFAGTNTGVVHLSTNSGASWTEMNTGLPGAPVYSFAVITANVFIGTGDGIYLSTNNGTNWNAAGLASQNIQALTVSGTNLFAGTTNGVYLSTNNGSTWRSVSTGLPDYPAVYSFSVKGVNLFIGTQGNGVWSRPLSAILLPPIVPTLASLFNGATNQPTSMTLLWNQSQNTTKYWVQASTTPDYSTLIADDSTIVDTSYQFPSLAHNTAYFWHVSAGNIAGWSAFSNTDSFATVTTAPLTPPVFSFPTAPVSSTSYKLFSYPGLNPVTVGSIIAGIQGMDWRMFSDNGKSTNYLAELSSTDNLLTGRGYWLLKKGDLNLSSQNITMPSLTGIWAYPIPLDTGWNIIANPFDRPVLWSNIVSQNSLDPATKAWTYLSQFIDTVTLLQPFYGYYFYNDVSLTSLDIPYPYWPASAPILTPKADWQVQIIFESDMNKDPSNYIGIATPNSGLTTYHSHKPPLMFDQGFLYFNRPEWDSKQSRFSEDFRPSIGDGHAWEFEVSNPRKSQAKISFKGIEQIPSEYQVVLINLFNTSPADVRQNNEYVFQTVGEKMLFKLIVGKKQFIENEVSKFLPMEFDLAQNFPNPFNPTTTISYSLPVNGHTMLKIYNVLGQEVAVLVNKEQSSGRYALLWDARGQASGMYFYRLIVNGHVIQIKKMLLVK